jgi:hypothetical protein
VQWYNRRKNQPVQPGSKFTLLEVYYTLMLLKRETNQGDKAFNMWCKFVAESTNTTDGDSEDNLWPPSFHVVKGVLGVEDGLCTKGTTATIPIAGGATFGHTLLRPRGRTMPKTCVLIANPTDSSGPTRQATMICNQLPT